uniref:Uncharacterized protein n=1 Tax=Onchocerca volvulus TaxID=6282 RepID=A0A8R1Y251_ONCVO
MKSGVSTLSSICGCAVVILKFGLISRILSESLGIRDWSYLQLSSEMYRSGVSRYRRTRYDDDDEHGNEEIGFMPSKKQMNIQQHAFSKEKLRAIS